MLVFCHLPSNVRLPVFDYSSNNFRQCSQDLTAIGYGIRLGRGFSRPACTSLITSSSNSFPRERFSEFTLANARRFYSSRGELRREKVEGYLRSTIVTYNYSVVEVFRTYGNIREWIVSRNIYSSEITL